MALFSPENSEVQVQTLWDFLATWVTPVQRQLAGRVFDDYAAAFPEVARLARVPQTAPWHSEGLYVRDHLIQMLLGLRAAIEAPEELLAVEELAAEKDLSADLIHLVALIKRHEKFLTAYIFSHDLAKADTLVIWDGTGAMPTRASSAAEIELFDKERRALFAEHDKTAHELSLLHAATTGLRVSYPRHSSEGAGEAYYEARHKILEHSGAGSAYGKLLRELISSHIDLMYAFKAKPDEIRVKALAAIAGRAGVAVDVFLDLIPACMFIDMLLGSRPVSQEHIRETVLAIKNFFAAERLALAGRAQERELAARRVQRAAEDVILREARFDADSIFSLLGTPVGPIRGQVMGSAFSLLKNPDAPADFAEKTEEIRSRARRARSLFIERGVKTDKL